MRCSVGKDKGDRVTGSDGELTDGLATSRAQRNRRAQYNHIRPRHGAERLVLAPRDPRDRGSVIEADDQFRPHRDFAALAKDNPHQIRRFTARRHEFYQRYMTLSRFYVCLKDERVVPIPTRGACVRLARCKDPTSVFRSAKQRRKAGATVKAGPAQPIDGSVARDQRARLAISQQGVIFDL